MVKVIVWKLLKTFTGVVLGFCLILNSSAGDEVSLNKNSASLQELLSNPPQYVKVRFITTRYLKPNGKKFQSSGMAEISKDYGVCWRMQTPQVKTFYLGGNEAEKPKGLEFLESLVKGDINALEQMFTLSFNGNADDGQVSFRPTQGAMARVIFSVNAVFKDKLLTKVTAVNQDGGSNTVEFFDFDVVVPSDLKQESFCRE